MIHNWVLVSDSVNRCHRCRLRQEAAAWPRLVPPADVNQTHCVNDSI